MALETITYTAPAYWASYLINGDASGLEDSEQAECDAWLDSIMELGMYGPTDWEEIGFCHSCDVGTLSGIMNEYTFLIER